MERRSKLSASCSAAPGASSIWPSAWMTITNHQHHQALCNHQHMTPTSVARLCQIKVQASSFTNVSSVHAGQGPGRSGRVSTFVLFLKALTLDRLSESITVFWPGHTSSFMSQIRGAGVTVLINGTQHFLRLPEILQSRAYRSWLELLIGLCPCKSSLCLKGIVDQVACNGMHPHQESWSELQSELVMLLGENQWAVLDPHYRPPRLWKEFQLSLLHFASSVWARLLRDYLESHHLIVLKVVPAALEKGTSVQ